MTYNIEKLTFFYGDKPVSVSYKETTTDLNAFRKEILDKSFPRADSVSITYETEEPYK